MSERADDVISRLTTQLRQSQERLQAARDGREAWRRRADETELLLDQAQDHARECSDRAEMAESERELWNAKAVTIADELSGVENERDDALRKLAATRELADEVPWLLAEVKRLRETVQRVQAHIGFVKEQLATFTTPTWTDEPVAYVSQVVRELDKIDAALSSSPNKEASE